MLKFNLKLTALAFLTLIAANSTVPAVATQVQSPAEQLCRLRPGIKPVCTVLVTAPNGVVIRSGPGSNYRRIGVIPYQHDVNVRVTSSSGKWVKLAARPGWIHYRYLQMAGD
ncbi:MULTISPECIES: SH3 domain-containing protein [unclassified Coleofasciculus]|uniref:SH3 domain-containing protein n=1 Tax=Cyanophyceae TaxID=3028117 RepID=UPI0016890699|nr:MULTISPECIES: SH3 domain-containing protein [unclassified Coleofasciculus]MBD1889872.1 SH3 domain-containing protein [Coleofasciculus sp. FACHB-SPT9]MBD1895875.1 SH3 domain-containing protein [Coleofasciculus sp. FACHB-129]